MEPNNPFRLHFVGNPGRGIDVPVLLRVLRALHLHRKVEVGCVVVSGVGAERGARAARGLLGELPPIMVAPGTELGGRDADEQPDPFFSAEPDYDDGYVLLRRLLGKKKPANLILTRPFTDIARVVREAPHLLTPAHVERVTIVSEAGDPFHDWLDPSAGEELGRYLSESDTPTVVVSAALARRCAVPLEVFEEAAADADEIGRFLATDMLEWARELNLGRVGAPLAALLGFLTAWDLTCGRSDLVALERDPSSNVAVCRVRSDEERNRVVHNLISLVRLGLLSASKS